MAADAPAWLDASRRDEHLALAAQYGPRRAFLPLARADEQGAAGFFVLGAAPGLDDWRVAFAGGTASPKPARPQTPKIEKPAVAAVTARAIPKAIRRKPVAPAKRPAKRERSLAERPRPPAPLAHGSVAPLGVRPVQQTQPVTEPRGSAPEAQNSPSDLINPFAFFAAPGAGEAKDWSN
jgi:hypothetical protein